MRTKTHRHFVAFPLAVFLMLGLAGLESVLQVGAAGIAGASVVSFKADAVHIDFQSGWMLSGTLESESTLIADTSGEHPELVSGQAVLRSAGYTELDVGRFRVFALSASYAVLRDASLSTVAPLTSPLIVMYGGGSDVIVPGMQFSIDTAGKAVTATVPPDWYAERLAALKLLPDLVIPELSTDVKDRHNLQVLLAKYLVDGRISADSFATADAGAHMLDPSGTAERLLLLRLLQEDARTDSNTSQMISERIVEDRFLAMKLVSVLPLEIATLLQPVAESHIIAWEKSALSLGLTDSEAALAVLRTYADFPQKLRRAGYPKQSLLWQHALSYVGTILRTTVSGEALDDIDTSLAVINRGDVSEEAAPKSEVTAYLPATSWSETELIAIVRHTLTGRGVLMAVTTELAPDTPTQTVRVTGVYMAEEGSDVPYVFTFDVARSLIVDISRDGKRLPNAVPADVFFR